MDAGASFGAWVKLRRHVLRFTQTELAQLVGCSGELIRKIEADARRPSTAIAERLAVFLELPARLHADFVKVARGQLRTDLLPNPDHLVAAPPVAASGVRPFTLPTPLTPLVGRARELTNLRACLQRTDVRLLTLTGAPGIGKTRLAIQVAADIGDAFADGVCFVALAPVSEPTAVVPAIVQALGIQERPGQSTVANAKDYLRDRQLLLVLDNFEHLLPAASLIADLLMGAPAVKALVTSRATLRISGEHEFVVAPLALPSVGSLPPINVLAHYSAIDLFVQSAQAIKPDFLLTEANASAIASICVRLDGLPLAIELASARIKLFPPEGLLARLEHRLAFLTAGPRDLPLRQQTLRSTIDWSYNLLSPDEQMLFTRLGIFVGGCTLAAAEAVCNVARDRPIDVLNGLASLVDKSLLQQVEGSTSEPRLVMLETLREYALERLEQSGDADALRQQHAEYYLALVEAAEPAFRGPQARRWMDRLAADYNNVRAALTWSQAAPDRAERGWRLAGALWWFWDQRSWLEGDTWLTRVLAQPEASAKSAVRAKALTAASFFAKGQGDLNRALVLGQEALTLARELDDQRSIAWALRQLAVVSNIRGDLMASTPVFEESLTLFQAIGDRFGVARTQFDLGYALFRQGDTARSIAQLEHSQALYRELEDISGTADTLWVLGLMALEGGEAGRAAVLFEESLALAQEAGDKWSVANALGLLGIAGIRRGDFEGATTLLAESALRWRDLQARSELALTLYHLGEVMQRRGYYASAAAYYDESLALYTVLGDKQQCALAICRLGYLSHKQGNDMQAAALFMDSLRACRECASQEGIASCLLGLGWASVARGQLARAAQLLGAAVQARPPRAAWLLGTAQPPLQVASNFTECFEQPEFDCNIVIACSQLDEASFAAAWATGHALTVEQAVAYALEE